MRYASTRGRIAPIEFQDAVMMGLADDGGLIVPESIPDASGSIDAWRGLAYPQLAFEVIRLFATDVPEEELRELIDRTYAGGAFDPDVAVTVQAGPMNILELWHGPTLAFKDVALQLLGNLFEYILERRGGFLNILGATSGDTGSAAIHGVRGREHIDIFIMHPAGRTSPIQERQMTTVLDDNVHNIAVEGSFDDCQEIMKQLAGDIAFKRAFSLGAVNSVNWARVLAQVVYYFKSAFDVQKTSGARDVRFCVPTGNFGDILAGWYAMKMGAPISGLILATNENNILDRFFSTGRYERGRVVHTTSPSMDIQVASNFERYLYYMLGENADRLREMMEGFAREGALAIEPGPDGAVDAKIASGSAHEDEVLATIREYHQREGYLLDPHTAVGVAVAKRLARPGEQVICLATAHPAKFPDAIRQATGQDLAHHPAIDRLMDLPTRCRELPNDAEAVRDFMIEQVGDRPLA